MMNFGDALNHAKIGGKIARRGWNGKNMFVFLHKGSAPGATAVEPTPFGMDLIEGIDADHFETGDKDTGVRLPSLALRTASGSVLVGWLASQSDLLAEDWQEVL